MPSIRKTKKRLKREIAELEMDFYESSLFPKNLYLSDAIYQQIKLLKQDLQQFKRKKSHEKNS